MHTCCWPAWSSTARAEQPGATRHSTGPACCLLAASTSHAHATSAHAHKSIQHESQPAELRGLSHCMGVLKHVGSAALAHAHNRHEHATAILAGPVILLSNQLALKKDNMSGKNCTGMLIAVFSARSVHHTRHQHRRRHVSK